MGCRFGTRGVGWGCGEGLSLRVWVRCRAGCCEGFGGGRVEVISAGSAPVLKLLCAHAVHRVAGQVGLGPLARSQELLLLVGQLVELLVGIAGRAAEVVLAWSGSGLGSG